MDKHAACRSVERLLAILGIISIIVNVFVLKLYFDVVNVNAEKQLEELNEEIKEVQLFVKDWYDEISSGQKSAEVYYNELRFEEGKYTLTIAANRIRAVYPRGERFYKLQNIKYIEFYSSDGRLLCRLYYSEKGEYVFKLN